MEVSWPFSNFVLSNDYNCTNFTSNNQLLEADAVAGPVLGAILKKDFIPDSILDQLNFSQPNDVVKVLSGNISDLVTHNEAWAAVTIGGGVCLIASLIAVLITLCVFCCLRPNRFVFILARFDGNSFFSISVIKKTVHLKILL